MKGLMKKALSFVMMMAMVATMLVLPNVDAKAADTITVTVSVDSSWGTPSVHYWGDNVGTDWPGVAMTAGANGAYTVEVPVAATHVIINNGGNGKQTINLAIEDVDTYIAVNANGAAKLSTTSMPNIPAETIKVYVKDCGWGAYSIHHWEGPSSGNWPGVAFTEGTDGWWSATVTSGFRKMIINNGDNGKKTQDIENVDTSGDIWVTIDSDNKGIYTTYNPEAADEAIAAIDAIGTVELSDECKNKINAAQDAYDAFLGDKSLITNSAKLTAAKAEWDNLMAAKAGKVTIYVKNPGWTDMALYAWNSNDDHVTDAWPGTKITELKENPGWYSCTFDATEAVSVIFNNNKSSNAEQTVDWKYVGAGTYWVTLSEKAGAKYVVGDENVSTTAPSGWKTEDAGKVEIKDPVPTPDNTPDDGGIKNTGDAAYLYALLLVAGCAVVVFASKKKFA